MHGTCNAWGMVPGMHGICKRLRADDTCNAWYVECKVNGSRNAWCQESSLPGMVEVRILVNY